MDDPRSILRSVWELAARDLARLAAALGVEPGRVNDVLQDVCVTALEKPPATGDRDELRRWLFRVTVNQCNLEHRRRGRWRRALGGLGALWRGRSQHDECQAAEQSEERAIVRAALARMDSRWRTVLVLRYFAELDSKEIGRILGLPDATVRSHLRKARQELAVELKRGGIGCE